MSSQRTALLRSHLPQRSFARSPPTGRMISQPTRHSMRVVCWTIRLLPAAHAPSASAAVSYPGVSTTVECRSCRIHRTGPDQLDALNAAPRFHVLLFENELVRVLDTRVPPR